jgi:hypothetical protein
MIYFAVDEPRIHLLAHYLAGEWGRPLRDRMRQITYPELFRTRSLPRGAWIFTALDALTHAELQMVHHIQCAARDAGLPVFNPAREAMHRYELLQLLDESGRNEFRAHRADGPLESVRFPVFVRVADQHDGSLTPLLHDRAALRRAMAYLWMRGLARRQLLVVEFCETAGADGLYRKYSIFRIGDACVPRYLHIGRHWMTKNDTRSADESWILEEMAYVRENPHAAWAREVFEMAHIEYGRLDYGLRGGRPQAWEINLTPVLAGNPDRPAETPEKQRIRKLMLPAKDHAHAAIRDAFQRIDPGPFPGDDIRVEFPVGLEEEARRERRAIQSLERRQQRIARIAAAPGMRVVGPMLRRTFGG